MGDETVATVPFDRTVEQAIVALKKGAHLLKCGQRGKPKFCPFRLSTDENFLIWYSGQEEKHLRLGSVTKIIPGQRTINFQRQLQPERECRSFSLIYENGELSLDLICKDKAQADSWFVGLKTVIFRCHHHRPLGASRSHRGAQSCVNSPVGYIRRKYNLGLPEDATRISQARNLEKQCQMRSEKIQECQQRIQETWSLARLEAAKCKAAKEVIRALTSRLHTMSEKLSDVIEGNDGVHVNVPQITTKNTDGPPLEGMSPKFLPPEVGLLRDGQVDSLCSSPIVFSDTLKAMYGRDVCHGNTRSSVVEHLCGSRTDSRQNGTKALKLEWVEQYEPGVYITFVTLSSGQKGLKRVRFSRKWFTEKEAERWWEENQVVVYQNYGIEGYRSSNQNKTEG